MAKNRRTKRQRRTKRRSRKQRGGVRADLLKPQKSLEIKREGDPRDDVDTPFRLVSGNKQIEA